MAVLRKIYPMLLLPLLAGCEEEFTPDMPHAPVLCVNSLVSTGEPIEVSVSRSRLYTDAAEKSVVDDAEVEVYANGRIQPDDYLPCDGDTVRIVARSKSAGSAEAEVVVPRAVPIKSVDWEAYDVYCSKFNERGCYGIQFKLKVKMTIADPAGDNYYRFTFGGPEYDFSPDDVIFMASHQPHYLSISDLQYDMEPIFGEHIGIFESIMGGDSYGFTFFTDRQFAGGEYTLNLVFNKCYFQGSLDDMPDCWWCFTLNSISQSYYNWANYAWQRDNGTLVEFGDVGLGDPIWGYSNCSSGAGVVAAQSPSTYTIDFTDFVIETIKNSEENYYY